MAPEGKPSCHCSVFSDGDLAPMFGPHGEGQCQRCREVIRWVVPPLSDDVVIHEAQGKLL